MEQCNNYLSVDNPNSSSINITTSWYRWCPLYKYNVSCRIEKCPYEPEPTIKELLQKTIDELEKMKKDLYPQIPCPYPYEPYYPIYPIYPTCLTYPIITWYNGTRIGENIF